ncbi:MAG: hypothetical protein QW689_07585, partial [Nitrososphaerota archaeon]
FQFLHGFKLSDDEWLRAVRPVFLSIPSWIQVGLRVYASAKALLILLSIPSWIQVKLFILVFKLYLNIYLLCVP